MTIPPDRYRYARPAMRQAVVERPFGSVVAFAAVEDSDRRAVIALLNNLAHYVQRGGELEWRDPSPRGRKGPSREAHRTISFTVREVHRFDAIGWELMKRDMRRRSEG